MEAVKKTGVEVVTWKQVRAMRENNKAGK
jgi:hypothetical protein